MPSATIYRSRWLLPIDRPPIDGGWIEVADRRITRVEAGRAPADARDLGDVAILPGLVNAHTHLELSWLEGRVRPAASMVEWIRNLIAERAGGMTGGPAAQREAMRKAVAAMRDAGTVLVGDVSNSLTSVPLLRDAECDAVVFHELLGFNVADPATRVRDAWTAADAAVHGAAGARAAGPIGMSVVAHAPYPVSPGLFAEIARRARHTPLSVHLGESSEEIEFLRTGRGPFRDLLVDLGAWDEAWHAPHCDPVEYLDRVGYLRPGVLAVHGVHLGQDALDRLREARGVIVTCPRSNLWVGGGMPRISRFYAAGVPVAIGTDSLASNSSLNLFDELAEMRRVAPDVSAASLLESATRVGAHALGYGRSHGTLAVGKRAALIAVDVPAGVSDVEEYLVGGVPVSSVRRLDC